MIVTPATAREHRADSRGAALVEFALVAILLFTLIFGIIAYGYMMSFRQALTQAAAEGARAGALAPTADVQTRARGAVNQALGGYGLDCAGGAPACEPCNAIGMTCVITPGPCANDATRQCVTVRISYDYDGHPLLPAPPLMGFIYPDQMGFTAVAETSS